MTKDLKAQQNKEVMKKSSNLQKTEQRDYDITMVQINNGSRRISEYVMDEPFTLEQSSVAVEMLIETFGFKKPLWDFIAEILYEDKWSMRKLKDAIKYVTKTQKYKDVKPSDVLSYDKGIQIYDYREMLEIDESCRSFFNVKIPGLPNWKQTDGETGTMRDGGWWVFNGTIIPETWSR